MGFESTIDILDDDVNDTANFLMRESDLDSITDNNNNFTYDDGDMTGDDVTVDPKELLLDHTNNNNLAPLIIRAKTNENNAKLYLPTGISTRTIIPTPPYHHHNKHILSLVFQPLFPLPFPSPHYINNKRLFRGIRRVC